jgi:chromosome segregation ATPase
MVYYFSWKKRLKKKNQPNGGIAYMELSFSFLSKLVGATVLSGVITLGAMTVWDGKDTVDNAITTIQGQVTDLNKYEMNENQLVTKINDLKTLRDSLQSEVNRLTELDETNTATITSLEGQIAEVNNEIASLEDQLNAANVEIANANTNSETLAQRIADLEAELTKANDDIERLQNELNNTDTSDNVPLTEAEMADILETPTEQPIQ